MPGNFCQRDLCMGPRISNNFAPNYEMCQSILLNSLFKTFADEL